MHGPIAVAPKINVKAALWAAVIFGMVFMMLEVIMVSVLMSGSPWGPPRMIAAVGMGERVLPPPATFDADVMVAMLIHLGLSMILAFQFAFIARGRPIGMTTLIGGAFGFVIHLISLYGITAVFPWFAMARGWISIFAHIAHGAVLGWVYVSVARRTR